MCVLQLRRGASPRAGGRRLPLCDRTRHRLPQGPAQDRQGQVRPIQGTNQREQGGGGRVWMCRSLQKESKEQYACVPDIRLTCPLRLSVVDVLSWSCRPSTTPCVTRRVRSGTDCGRGRARTASTPGETEKEKTLPGGQMRHFRGLCWSRYLSISDRLNLRCVCCDDRLSIDAFCLSCVPLGCVLCSHSFSTREACDAQCREQVRHEEKPTILS